MDKELSILLNMEPPRFRAAGMLVAVRNGVKVPVSPDDEDANILLEEGICMFDVTQTHVVMQRDETDLKEMFERFRLYYPGTKRGLEVEFSTLKKHKDWRRIPPILTALVTLDALKEWRERKDAGNKHYVLHMQTFLNQRAWERDDVQASSGPSVSAYLSSPEAASFSPDYTAYLQWVAANCEPSQGYLSPEKFVEYSTKTGDFEEYKKCLQANLRQTMKDIHMGPPVSNILKALKTAFDKLPKY